MISSPQVQQYKEPAVPMVETVNLCKAFGTVQASNNISLQFAHGSIKALLGENGAGKSTFMSMLAGRLQPDSGTILIDGVPTRLTSPKIAHAAGIGMVYQHFMLMDSMTVAENILLGQGHGFLFSPRAACAEVARLAEQYGLSIDPTASVGKLSMGERQRVEILKLLSRNSRLLIFDEPTAVLTPTETDQLFVALRNMASLGKSIVFISHKLQEVIDIADEITILRRGEVVDSFARALVPDKESLARRMVGRGVDLAFSRPAVELAEEVLAITALNMFGLSNISLSLRKGEVLAIAGVAGNGQKELVEVLAGLAAPPRNTVTLLGEPWHKFFPQAPRVNGMAYIPEDRQGVATCPALSLVDNVLISTRELFTDGVLLSRQAAYAATLQLLAAYAVRPGNPQALGRALSGGNLQKLVVARELLRQPAFIIAENPTQGLDVAATEDVWTRLTEARKQAGILLVTGDMAEALQLADRIAVMYRGRFVDTFPISDTAKVNGIAAMMAGLWH